MLHRFNQHLTIRHHFYGLFTHTLITQSHNNVTKKKIFFNQHLL